MWEANEPPTGGSAICIEPRGFRQLCSVERLSPVRMVPIGVWMATRVESPAVAVRGEPLKGLLVPDFGRSASLAAIAVVVTVMSSLEALPALRGHLSLLSLVLGLAVGLAAVTFRLPGGVRYPALRGLMVVTAALVAGGAGGAVTGWASGLPGMRRSTLPQGLGEAAGCSLAGSAAGWVASRTFKGAFQTPLLMIGASVAAASAFGLTLLVVDQLCWYGGRRSAWTAAVYRVTVAADVLVAGAFACALVGASHVWGMSAVAATLSPVAAAIAVFHWYVRRQARSRELLARARSEAEERARVDALTGVGNRRCFDETLTAEASRARRGGGAVSLVLLDLDHFKQFNDTHGHQAGDAVLVEAARRLQSCARAGDLVARYGGEEFAVIVDETDGEEGLLRAAERVRTAIAQESFVIGGLSLAVTASVGAARMTTPESDELIAAADEALYLAKRQGRNRTVVAGAAASR
jgi:diguanylate cyclase (GGDEF)-like protein